MSLAGKPSQMTVFDALYSIAAGDGRGEALFGNSFGIARDAYERTLVRDTVQARIPAELGRAEMFGDGRP